MKLHISKSGHTFLLIFVLIVLATSSLKQLTTYPRLFMDEGLTIEISRNFELFGVLDISTAPGQFTDAPYINGSTGFPVTIPLALFFKFFGFGLIQARLYALLWLITCLITVYYFCKYFWGNTHAISAVFLVATFAPFHDSGRRVLGEIPGFVFLLIGLYILLRFNLSLTAGIFFGLASVSKPSIYLLIAPALILSAIFIKREIRSKILPILLGMGPAFLIWIWLAFPNPLDIDTWNNLLAYYQNPTTTSLSQTILNNLHMLMTHTTLIYFLLLTSFIIVASFYNRPFSMNYLSGFLLFYGIFQLVYFLKSPGWLRYLLPTELLILMIFPTYLQIFFQRIKRTWLYLLVIAAFIVIQGTQLIYFSDITNASSEAQDIANYLSQQSGMVGIIKSPQVACLIDPSRKLHYMPYNKKYVFGGNPLDLSPSELPRFLITPTEYIDPDNLDSRQRNNLELYRVIQLKALYLLELK